MPDPHSFPIAASGIASQEAALGWPQECDFALGAECADPALQIERWRAECAGAGAEPS